jgi:phosphatidylserine synthase
VNRLLDSLDGSLARLRGSALEMGGFLDLLCDFIIYSLIPPAVACGEDRYRSSAVGLSPVDWRSVAFLEGTFHINNFVLFYVAAIAAKVQFEGGEQKSTDLTSLIMKPALVEGFESAVAFTLMLTFPSKIESLAWGMSCAVLIGIVQRLSYIIPVLRQVDRVDKA